MEAMKRYVCIHGHFYQPPRENPWLEAIEVQDSAYPYHDWNDRITAECYAPNSASRILDGEERIIQITNNYARISFNFGPTLLSWLQDKAPRVYQAILDADKASQQRFTGHGTAIAQVYNHMIMPLANRHDKETQIVWGIRDFESRFGRKPEGMWLAETAVDLETLDLLSQHDIRYSILSPTQARQVREVGGETWRNVEDGSIDPSLPYRVTLPSKKMFALFFYDGPISHAVAFEGLLKRGEFLAGRLAQAFSPHRRWSQLVHIATDGETYGHHQFSGDMALAYALEHIETAKLAKLTNYGEHLDRQLPLWEVQIKENTSWSCVHGVERWRSDCGCNSGGHPDWNQSWRAPLRQALDWLRDQLIPRFERKGAALFREPWAARNDYINVVLNRTSENIHAYLDKHQSRKLMETERIEALKLMEMQRHAMLMFTSCGWFFDELSGIETVQVIQYAGRALQLCEELCGDGLESEFLNRLGQARSNIAGHGDGRRIYDKFVKPAMVDLEKVGAHYAISSLFENYGAETKVYCYDARREDFRLLTSGKVRLALGRASIKSRIVLESKDISFGVLHLGNHDLSGGVREFQGEKAYARLLSEIAEAFERADVPATLRAVDQHFGSGSYTLKLLFRDEQRKIVRLILEPALVEAEVAYRRIFEQNAPLMRFMAELNMTSPRRFRIAAEFTVTSDLRRALESESLNFEQAKATFAEARKSGIALDVPTLEFAVRHMIERLTRKFEERPDDLVRLQNLQNVVEFAISLPFPINFWLAQNVYFRALREIFPARVEKAKEHEKSAEEWTSCFRRLGEQLRVRVD
jgi:alpha-amylase/alpha-mannosidase (GH57 family)